MSIRLGKNNQFFIVCASIQKKGPFFHFFFLNNKMSILLNVCDEQKILQVRSVIVLYTYHLNSIYFLKEDEYY